MSADLSMLALARVDLNRVSAKKVSVSIAFLRFPAKVAASFSRKRCQGMVQSDCCISQIALSEEKKSFKWQEKLDICFDSKINSQLTKIKRKNSLDDLRSFVIQEFAFTFVHISLLRKHSLQLPSRSLISNQKKLIFNCGKVWKQLNNWKEAVLGTRS